jgi:DNA polymerase-1
VPQTRPLVVVDGDAIAHRAYYALRNVVTRDGRPSGLLQGSVSMLLAAWDTLDPRALAVGFDSRVESPRHERWPTYQGQRDTFAEDLVEQLDALPALVAAFGIPAVTIAPWEADDVCASFVAAEETAGGSSLVITHDRDFFQLASARTTIVRPLTGLSETEFVDPAGVRDRYGVEPRQVPDLIALRGDPSDNLPGARGIGQKTAAELLGRYGDLEGVIAHVGDLTKARAAAIAGAAAELRDFREIASMRRDLPVTRPPDAVPDWAAGADACEAAGLTRLAGRVRERVL